MTEDNQNDQRFSDLTQIIKVARSVINKYYKIKIKQNSINITSQKNHKLIKL